MIVSLYNYAIRLIFGIDIFISYSRKDAIVYAEKLAIVLQEMGFRCYIDKWKTEPGKNNSNTIASTLRHSSLFVILGTKNSILSKSVREEVISFVKTQRVIVPINFGFSDDKEGALELTIYDEPKDDNKRIIRKADWYQKFRGLAITDESLQNLKSGEPSELVIKRIVNSFIYQKQSRRLRLATIGILGVLVILICLIGYSSFQLSDIRKQRELLKTNNEVLSQNNESLNLDNSVLKSKNDSIKVAISALNDSILLTESKYKIAKENEEIEKNRANMFWGATESITSNIGLALSGMTDEEIKSHELLDSLSKVKLSKMKHKEDSLNNQTLKQANEVKFKTDSLKKLKQHER